MIRAKKKWLFAVPLVLGCGYLAVNPQPMYAIFGLGDVVFDPTSYAQFTKIWSEDVSNGVKLAQTYNQAVKIVANGLQIYNLSMQMAQRVQNKNVWKTAGFAVGDEIAETHYNENVNFNAVMNGDVLHAGQAWHQSTFGAGNAGYLGNATASNSSRMAEFATIQMLDQTSQRCAAILGNYKQMQAANQAAADKLVNDTFDQTDAKNSMVAVLNVLSGGGIHLQNQTKANGNLQACLAEQQTLQNKLQRDRLAAGQFWYADAAFAKANTPSQIDPAMTAAFVDGGYLEP
jgi:hypothetical protein